MTWFNVLTGFLEQSANDVRSNFRLDGTQLTSLVNNRTLDAGGFTTPSLSQLRDTTGALAGSGRNLRINELVGDVRLLHQDPANKHAVFQVASQFNCLEMASPHVTPEDGVGIYQEDLTQGPACSISAGAGTIFRNYFAEVNGRMGQTYDNQVDCLSEIGRHFNNEQHGLWTMQNGYCFPTSSGLAKIESQLSNCVDHELDDIRAKLKVGVQSKTQVTIGDFDQLVTQVFCSALPIAYSEIASSKWYYFPRLILDATYEATFHVALQNLKNTGCNKLYLTLVGGGVFGNKLDWILSSIARSLEIFASAELDVYIVSYGTSKPEVANFLALQNDNRH
ncbi:MAG: hypothetical protein AAF282_01580 [Cyanobacteria bacterium P01_A01_bin.15]